MGLEGKLLGVEIGDFIIISGSNGNAGGYIHAVKEEMVALSTIDPKKPASYSSYHNLDTVSHTIYNLKYFEAFEVLKKSSQQ